jgi:hypothetical protein
MTANLGYKINDIISDLHLITSNNSNDYQDVD